MSQFDSAADFILCVYVYNNSNFRNDVLRVAQRYGTIAAHTRRSASVYGMLNVALFDLFTLLFYLFYLYLQKVYYYSIIVYNYCIFCLLVFNVHSFLLYIFSIYILYLIICIH